MGLFQVFQMTNSLPGQGVLCIFVAKRWKKILNYRRGSLTSKTITKTLKL